MPDAQTGDRVPGNWTGRRWVAEACCYLMLARLLVGFVPFGRWRRWLGAIVPSHAAIDPGQQAGGEQRRLAHAVDRAARRLPFECKCLVRAIALHRMLARRGIPSILAIATLPGKARGTLDDLHAWIEIGEDVLLGQSELPYIVLIRFAWHDQ